MTRALTEYADLLDHEDGTLVCSWACNTPVAAAEAILRRIAASHQDPSLRRQARWDLASRLVHEGKLIAEVQTTPEDLQPRLIQDLGRGRFERLAKEDAKSSVTRLEQLLQLLAEEDAATPPYVGAFHLFPLLTMESAYHRNADLLLDRSGGNRQ